MNIFEHIKLAAFTGAMTGLLFGIIDVLARSFSFALEWFEVYQSLLINTTISVLGFVLLCFFIEILSKFVKLKTTKKNLYVFYFATSLAFILFIYGEVFINFVINNYLFPQRWDTACKIASYILPLLVILLYVLLLRKRKDFLFNIILFFSKKKYIKKVFKNFVFIIAIFIVISFLMDIYLLSSIPSFKPKNQLDGYPNVIIMTLDTVRADHVSLYGYPIETSPNIDKLAENAVVFENAIAPSSWTLPSHSSIFTGKHPSHHGATKKNQFLDYKEITLAEILSRKGYNTVGFSSGAFTKAKYGLSQGFLMYKDRLDFFEFELTFNEFDLRGMINRHIFSDFNKYVFRADRERTSEEINKDVFKWLDKNKDTPFFMFIHYYDAHDPYILGKEFRKKFTNKTINYEEIKITMGRILSDRYGYVSQELVDYMIELYDTEIFYLDYNLGKLFKKLDELGLKENTIIIITADHGEEFYEHGGFTHSTTLYEEALHVPLIIYYPKELKQQRIEKKVEIINIFSTILDILNIEPPEDIDSISFVPLIKNRGSYNQNYVYSELIGRPSHTALPDIEETNQQALSYGNWKLIEVNPEKKGLVSSLFNLKTDSQEQNNLYNKHTKTRMLLQGYLSNESYIRGD